MQYGILTHIGFSKKGEENRRIISIGDVLECFAIRNIYESMNVSEESLIECYPYELNTYAGPYCVLPINVYALSIDYSPRILPVFLGLTLGGDFSLTERDLKLLQRFSPVGCRDERTMRKLNNQGIPAYMQGCLVATFPKRNSSGPQDKVFFVNAEKGIADYIPDSLLNKYEFVSHDYYSTASDLYKNGGLYELARSFIRKYQEEARLVVTSKYHSAVLCLALGIPVIMVLENNYYKYSWLERFIPIYEPKDYPDINWNPEAICIPSEEKQLMLRIARSRIQDTYSKYHDICELSEIRERQEIARFKDIFYGNGAIEYIKRNWQEDIEIEYAFWGATETAKELNAYIASHYAKARLVKVFDWSVRAEIEYTDGFFIPEPTDNIARSENKGLFIFVTGNSASEAAKDLFEQIQKDPATFYLCQRQVLKAEDLMRS